MSEPDLSAGARDQDLPWRVRERRKEVRDAHPGGPETRLPRPADVETRQGPATRSKISCGLSSLISEAVEGNVLLLEEEAD